MQEAEEKKIDVDAFVFCDTGFEQSIVFDFLYAFTLPMLEKAYHQVLFVLALFALTQMTPAVM